jgi:asparagine synthase (glutamine-hydrolysing)
MCGIAGLLKMRGPITPEDRAAVERMTHAQRHRGPDGAGMYADTRVVLGHRRLSIIDLSDAGRQPMANADGTLWVTYNGEIYNFAALRAALCARGYHFRSRTDTEVLLHGYDAWGEEGLLARLRGMFAFALYDARTPAPRLILARDRLGKKPLYYAWNGSYCLFASELKALLASGLLDRRLNPAALVAYLTFGSVPAPLTMIDGIAALSPGHYLVLHQDKVTQQRYWHPHFVEDQRLSTANTVARVHDLLREAVRLRLISDVPLGAFLSGGIDSSAIVALMRDITGGTIRTFSMVFREAEFSEGAFAQRIAQRFGTEHTAYEVTSDEVLHELPQIIWAMDQPSLDGINTYFVSKVTRQSGTVVALSGVGGDEVFGGYPTFARLPRLYCAAQVAHAVPGGAWLVDQALGLRASTSRVEKLRTIFQHAPCPEATYLALRGLFLDGDLLALVAHDLLAPAISRFAPLAYLQEITAPQNGADVRNLTSLLELRTYLHNQLLRDTDVMSMAHALEVRTPLLDHELVEFLASVPARMKFAGRPKSLLLHALNGRLPREVVERPKGTFTFPFVRWFTGAWRHTIEDSLHRLKDTEVLNAEAGWAVWQGFLQGRMHWSRVWALVVLQLWHEQYVQQATRV